MEIKELAYAEKSHKEHCDKLNKMVKNSNNRIYWEFMKIKIFGWILFSFFSILLIYGLYKCPKIEYENKTAGSSFTTRMITQSMMMRRISRI